MWCLCRDETRMGRTFEAKGGLLKDEAIGLLQQFYIRGNVNGTFLSFSYHFPIIVLSFSYHFPNMFPSLSYHFPNMFPSLSIIILLGTFRCLGGNWSVFGAMVSQDLSMKIHHSKTTPNSFEGASTNHQQPPTTTINNQQPPTTTINNQQQPTTTINNHQQPTTTINNHQQPTTNGQHRPGNRPPRSEIHGLAR